MGVYDIDGNEISGGALPPVGEVTVDYDAICKSVNHRGYNISAPENTIPAFKLSRQNGFVYVETDVQFTLDGVAVLLHDETINRTARNSDGSQISETVNIADITYEQALTYDFGIWKNAKYAGTKIPTLTEFLVLCKRLGMRPYIELKVGTEAQIQSIVDAVKANGLKGRETYISFNTTLLGYVKTYDETARLGVLDMASDGIRKAANLLTGKNETFVDSNVQNNSNYAQQCAGYGIGYEVWTVNSANTVKVLNPYISGVTTDGQVNAGKIMFDDNMNFVDGQLVN